MSRNARGDRSGLYFELGSGPVSSTRRRSAGHILKKLATNQAASWVAMSVLLLTCTHGAVQAATFNIADGDVAGLIAAITTSNGNNQADVINLAPGGTYTLTAVHNTSNGPNGLPVVTGDSAPLTINGNGAVIRRDPSAADMRLLRIGAGTAVTLINLRLENGSTTDSGGAIRSDGALSLIGCEFNNNFAAVNGGAILAQGGSLISSDTLFSNNEAGDNGGAILSFVLVFLNRNRLSLNSAANSGGALAGLGISTVQDSLFDGNTATNGAGIFTQGEFDLISSTLSSNIASNVGGGLAMASGHTRVDQSTVTANQSAGSGGGLFRNPGGMLSLRLRNSIVAGNAGTQISGALAAGSSNNLVDGNPRLGALQNNGGSTPTHALLPGSPAINAANNTHCPAQDQRSVPRPQGGTCDIGAFESRGFNLTLFSGDAQSTIVGTGFADNLIISISSPFGEPVNGGQVRFIAPDSGASLSEQISLATIIGGQAGISATANEITGDYAVTATAEGGTNTVAFNLTNLPVTFLVTASTVSGQGMIIVDNEIVVAGETASFTVSPDTGWTVFSVDGDTCTPELIDGTQWQASNIQADCSVEASFVINSYSLGGTVTGLAGSGLALALDGVENLPISDNGSFTFATELDHGTAWTVTVASQPTNPSQTCTVTNGNSAAITGDVSDIQINCSTNTFTVGGTVSGLAGTGLVLQNNKGDDLAINADGAFTFAIPLADLTAYNVTVLTRPSGPSQTCFVANNSGTLSGTDVDDVAVTCITDADEIFADRFQQD